MSRHAPLLVVYRLIPLAPTVFDFHTRKGQSIVKKTSSLIHYLVLIAFWQFFWVTDIRLDDIEFDDGLVTSFRS